MLPYNPDFHNTFQCPNTCNAAILQVERLSHIGRGSIVGDFYRGTDTFRYKCRSCGTTFEGAGPIYKLLTANTNA